MYMCMTVYTSVYIYIDIYICVYMDGFISLKKFAFYFLNFLNENFNNAQR